MIRLFFIYLNNKYIQVDNEYLFKIKYYKDWEAMDTKKSIRVKVFFTTPSHIPRIHSVMPVIVEI